MENSFQTSFIPKKPIIENGSFHSSKNKSSMSISIIVTLLLLIVMVLSAGGLFLYKGILTKNEDNLSASLLKVKNSFDENTISQLELYDKRASVSSDILGKHIVLSPLFNLINDLTLKSIQYTKFSHNMNNGIFTVKMSGIAHDYKSIAQQADVFDTTKGQMFKDVIFSNLTIDKSNNVTFDVEFTVDPSLLSYKNMIASESNSTDNVNASSTTSQSSTNDSASANTAPASSTTATQDRTTSTSQTTSVDPTLQNTTTSSQ